MKQLKYIIIIIGLVAFSGSVLAQSLQDYFREAAESNPGLRAKHKAYEAAMQRVPQANTLQDPSFSFGWFLSPVETRVGAQRMKFSLTQMFPWFGTLKARGDVAALRAEARFQEFLEARNKLYYRVAEAYYPLYELKRKQQVEKENISILQSYKRIAEARFKSGKGEMVDVLRVDIMLNDARTNLEILQEKEQSLATAFNKLLNKPSGNQIQVSDSLTAEALPDHYRRDSLLAGNPALRAHDFMVEAGQAVEEVARKKGLPQFGVGVDYTVVDKRPDMASGDNGKDVLMPMVSVSIPVFRKKTDAAIEEARLEQERYGLLMEERANQLESEYDATWFEMLQQEKLLSLYKQQIRQTTQSLDLLIRAYGNSGKDFEELLRMQQKLLRYEKERASALAAYHIAIAEINYITAKNY